jgi:exopolyphosphatase/pppGpp-phosphohydrolase
LVWFVPTDKRDGLDEARLKQAWEGDQKEEMQRLIEGLKSQLATAKVEILGSRATVAYGAGGTVQLLLEDGAWKIEDL